MKAVILAGGFGTRLGEETNLKPKPMIEIGGKPLLWNIMKIYSYYNINEFIICCGYKGYYIKEYFSNYHLHTSDVTFNLKKNVMEMHRNDAEPWQVTLVDTGLETRTGGRIKRIQQYVKDETFCLTYGDGVSDINIADLINFHRHKNLSATVTAVRTPGRFGSLNIDADKVINFTEKPAEPSNRINGGFFVLEPTIFDFIEGDETDWERQPLENLAKKGELGAYLHDGFWQPVDTLREKNYLEELYNAKQTPWLKNTPTKLTPNADFWKNKKVFITGHTGFKGSWLSLWLQQLQAQVIGYSLPAPTEPNLFTVADVGKNMTSVIGDVRNYNALASALNQFSPEIVIHLAAQSLVKRSYANPDETYSTNIMGTFNLLEAVRHTSSVKAVVVVTSDKCYQNSNQPSGRTETDALGGFDPYSSSKACAELVVSAFRNSFFNSDDFEKHGVAVASARAGNVIGGGDWAADRIIPDCIKSLVKNEAPFLRYPNAIRPWQHVLEPLSGYLTLSEKLYEAGPEFAEAWNFGPQESDEKPVKWIAEQMALSWGATAGWTTDDQPHPYETAYLKLDCAKARSRLLWHPVWDIQKALAQTVDWYKTYFNDAGQIREKTIEQITEYARAAAKN